MSYATSSDQSQVMSSTPSPSDASAVPDLVRIGQIPSNTAIDIETDVLDPVVHTDSFCRFQFQNKGILHSNSKIVFRLQANAESAYLPVGVGIHSLIQRVALRVGTKTVSEIDDFAHYIAYKSMFLSNEHQKQRELFISGRRLAHKPYYNEGANDWGGAENVLQTSAQRVGLDVGVQTSATRTQTDGDITDRLFVKTTSNFGPEFSVSIQDLFPFLYTNQLPLFMMTEPVTIEIFFNDAINERMCLPESGSGSAATASFRIDTTATELIADYQYFPQEMMEQYAAQNANLSFTFMDYRLAKRTIPVNASGTEASTGQLIVNVGGAGRLVTKVFTTLSDDNVKGISMLQNYHSKSLTREYTGSEDARFNGVLTANCKYNDHFLYPVDVDNSAQQFHNLTQGEGMVPFVYREEYNFEGQGLASGLYEGHSQKNEVSGLAGQFFYQCYKLNRNERVNSRGIELYNTWDKLKNSKDAGANTMTLRSYVELIRVAQLVDGKMEVFFA